jgi:hypothetical protein
MNLRRWCLILLLGATAVFGNRQSFLDHAAVREPLSRVPPWMRGEWLRHHGIGSREPGFPTTLSDSGGLKLVGKWGRGPASSVTGRDTLVVLTLGSEVALLSFAESDSPRVLSEIQFSSLTSHSFLKDSLLYTSSKADFEVWNIADPTQPVKRGQFPGAAWTFWIRDTFLYYIRYDTLHIVSIADPANMYELGPVLVTGYAVTGSGNTLIVCRDGGFAFLDISNPVSPHEVGTYACGHPLTATVRGNLVCASYEESGYPYPARFVTLDISTPSSPRLLAKLNDLGGFDIFLDGPLAFVSGGDLHGADQMLPFQIISIADSAHPAFIDSCRTTTYGYAWGVWESFDTNLALVAIASDGLAVVDISNLNNPVLRTWLLKAGESRDLHVDGQRCYVACLGVGMRLLDVSDPTRPTCISGLDSAFKDVPAYAVAARDSFAYISWEPNPFFRTVSVADPLRPQIVAGCLLPGFPEGVVLRDSYAYVAQDYGFHVINVARPRAPTLVATCELPDDYCGMDSRDTLAFVANGVSGLQIVSVAQPDSPAIIGEFTPPNGACDVSVVDTFAYVVSGNLYIASVANATSPYLIDSIVLPTFGWSVATSDSMLFVGSNGHVYGHPGNDIHLFDIKDPVRPVLIGSLGAPEMVRRLVWVDPYLYAACGNAGVLIAETAAVGIQEPSLLAALGAKLRPTVVRGAEWRSLTHGAEVFDAMGRRVTQAKPGVYFVRGPETDDGRPGGAIRKVVLVE